MTLQSKVAFATGGARGQGRSHAIALAEAGADIATCDLGADRPIVNYSLGRSDQIEETMQLIEKLDRPALLPSPVARRQ